MELIKHHGWSEHEILSLQNHRGDAILASYPHRLIWTIDTQILSVTLISGELTLNYSEFYSGHVRS